MLEINRGLYDFNYYYLYLLQYLRSNKYEVDNDHPQLQANSIAALDAFEEARRNGATVTMAEEEAIRVLFTNIGESEYNIVSELILENFGDTIDLEVNSVAEVFKYQLGYDVVLRLSDVCEQDSYRFFLSHSDCCTVPACFLEGIQCRD